MTWTLTHTEYEATRERAAKINARAVKRGFTGRIEVTGVEREISETGRDGLKRARLVVDTDIAGEAPCYNGWVFVAAVDAVETEVGTSFVIRTAPGVEESGIDRDALVAGRCQHCNTTRTNRIYTYLVRNVETGETVQVGSTCIKDFTGWAGKPVFIDTEALKDELGGFIGGFAPVLEDTPETVVAVAWAVSRVYGWVPASAAWEGRRATRDLVTSYLYGRSKADKELQTEIAPEVPAAAEMAKTIISTLLEGLEGSGDYVTNLRVLLQAGHVEDRHMGIVVSAVAAYERLIGQRVRKEARAKEAAASEFAGAVGEKLTVSGVVATLKPVETDYGMSMLVIVEAGSTVAKMFTTAAWAWEVKQGQEVTLTGTVKAHEAYNGAKQTVMTRAKLHHEPELTPEEKRAALISKARAWAAVNLTNSYPGSPARYTQEELDAMDDEDLYDLVEGSR
jgi:hypothetical protein